MNGTKHDGGKPRFSLFPNLARRAIVEVLEFGARKYSLFPNLARRAIVEVLEFGARKYSLFPNLARRAIVEVLEFGARKYSPGNWRHVDQWRTQYYDAAMRHIDAWWNGERLDQESGHPHLAHAICCLVFCLELDGEKALFAGVSSEETEGA